MDHLKANKTAWDRRTEIHSESAFYNVDGFLSGDTSLNPIELEIFKEVAGKSVLHLQCHFGLDSLSLTRLGAEVTGVDLSSSAIVKARSLAKEAQLDAQFICSDVCQLRDVDSKQYDFVYSSYGVICWLPDLTQWANVIAASLKPGAEFHLIEFHPFYDVFAGYPYFNTFEPYVESESTYTENAGDETQTIVTWAHAISEVLNALIGAGLMIKSFDEYDYSPYDCFEGLVETTAGKFQLIKNGEPVPLLFSVVAEKPMLR